MLGLEGKLMGMPIFVLYNVAMAGLTGHRCGLETTCADPCQVLNSAIDPEHRQQASLCCGHYYKEKAHSYPQAQETLPLSSAWHALAMDLSNSNCEMATRLHEVLHLLCLWEVAAEPGSGYGNQVTGPWALGRKASHGGGYRGQGTEGTKAECRVHGGECRVRAQGAGCMGRTQAWAQVAVCT